jgi:hypothetical protein
MSGVEVRWKPIGRESRYSGADSYNMALVGESIERFAKDKKESSNVDVKRRTPRSKIVLRDWCVRVWLNTSGVDDVV